MPARVRSFVVWLAIAGLGLSLGPLLWWLLTHQTTSSCYGLWDGVSTTRLLTAPLRSLVRSPGAAICVAPLAAMSLVGLAIVLRRPSGLGWTVSALGWIGYAVVTVLWSSVGC